MVTEEKCTRAGKRALLLKKQLDFNPSSQNPLDTSASRSSRSRVLGLLWDAETVQLLDATPASHHHPLKACLAEQRINMAAVGWGGPKLSAAHILDVYQRGRHEASCLDCSITGSLGELREGRCSFISPEDSGESHKQVA